MFVRQIIVLLLAMCGVTTSALAQGLVGDWIGQMSGSFKIRIRFEREVLASRNFLFDLPTNNLHPIPPVLEVKPPKSAARRACKQRA
jgi:hypothetical protein